MCLIFFLCCGFKLSFDDQCDFSKKKFFFCLLIMLLKDLVCVQEGKKLLYNFHKDKIMIHLISDFRVSDSFFRLNCLFIKCTFSFSNTRKLRSKNRILCLGLLETLELKTVFSEDSWFNWLLRRLRINVFLFIMHKQQHTKETKEIRFCEEKKSMILTGDL